MQVTVSRISQVLLELQVDIPADKVKAEVERVYSSLSKKAHVKGYRPGKAPRPVLKTLYGAQVENDVANNLVNANLPVALSEKNVTPISQPQVTDASRVSGDAPFTFKARMEVQPELDEVKYEGFQLYRPKVEVADAEVDAQIESLRVRHAAFKTPEPARPAAAGDVVTIDFTLSLDGKPVTDGGGEGVQLELGAGQALPELDAALVGKSVGDSLDVDAAFQPNHPRKDFQGKTGKFSVKVTDVKERQLPEVDDEFAKDVGNFGTVVELRADIHTRLEKLA
ncbi:MAG TPA: trigger factor, partial [Polyangiaceae bacterium]|nr:trigger factor [Polyangiaceae bacterium]